MVLLSINTSVPCTCHDRLASSALVLMDVHVAAACTKDGNGITYAEHVNVAVAVSMPDGGLITPVIKVGPSFSSLQQ